MARVENSSSMGQAADHDSDAGAVSFLQAVADGKRWDKTGSSSPQMLDDSGCYYWSGTSAAEMRVW